MWAHSKKVASASCEEGSYQELNLTVPWSGISTTVRKWKSVFKPPVCGACHSSPSWLRHVYYHFCACSSTRICSHFLPPSCCSRWIASAESGTDVSTRHQVLFPHLPHLFLKRVGCSPTPTLPVYVVQNILSFPYSLSLIFLLFFFLWPSPIRLSSSPFC